MTIDEYCRELEDYLCRKNDGHLIRISGPAFERVSAWARQGIPFKVACEGIDRYFERYYRRGPRRRPVQIQFCEADVLDAFDAWRRAVGVAMEQAHAAPRRASLASHLERAIARVTALRASSQAARRFDDTLAFVARELDALAPQAKSARGAARDHVLARLATLDRVLMDAAIESLDGPARAAALEDAREQLAPFRERMSREEYERACTAAAERHARELYGLPMLSLE